MHCVIPTVSIKHDQYQAHYNWMELCFIHELWMCHCVFFQKSALSLIPGQVAFLKNAAANLDGMRRYLN